MFMGLCLLGFIFKCDFFKAIGTKAIRKLRFDVVVTVDVELYLPAKALFDSARLAVEMGLTSFTNFHFPGCVSIISALNFVSTA